MFSLFFSVKSSSRYRLSHDDLFVYWLRRFDSLYLFLLLFPSFLHHIRTPSPHPPPPISTTTPTTVPSHHVSFPSASWKVLASSQGVLDPVQRCRRKDGGRVADRVVRAGMEIFSSFVDCGCLRRFLSSCINSRTGFPKWLFVMRSLIPRKLIWCERQIWPPRACFEFGLEILLHATLSKTYL